jgi:predicted nicotinamide N-methyase
VNEADFVRAQTAVAAAPLVPEIALHLATEITPLWQASEDWLRREGLPPPFWAFAWPGSQALARHVLDGRLAVAGLRVLDFAAGGGLAAIACARRGAAVEAAELDPLAGAAIRLNAARNGVALTVTIGDLVGASCRWDLILCGDVFYEAPMTGRIVPWLRRMARAVPVIVGDPGRAYAPLEALEEIARFRVPTTLELEDALHRTVRLCRLIPAPEPDR